MKKSKRAALLTLAAVLMTSPSLTIMANSDVGEPSDSKSLSDDLSVDDTPSDISSADAKQSADEAVSPDSVDSSDASCAEESFDNNSEAEPSSNASNVDSGNPSESPEDTDCVAVNESSENGESPVTEENFNNDLHSSLSADEPPGDDSGNSAPEKENSVDDSGSQVSDGEDFSNTLESDGSNLDSSFGTESLPGIDETFCDVSDSSSVDTKQSADEVDPAADHGSGNQSSGEDTSDEISPSGSASSDDASAVDLSANEKFENDSGVSVSDKENLVNGSETLLSDAKDSFDASNSDGGSVNHSFENEEPSIIEKNSEDSFNDVSIEGNQSADEVLFTTGDPSGKASSDHQTAEENLCGKECDSGGSVCSDSSLETSFLESSVLQKESIATEERSRLTMVSSSSGGNNSSAGHSSACVGEGAGDLQELEGEIELINDLSLDAPSATPSNAMPATPSNCAAPPDECYIVTIPDTLELDMGTDMRLEVTMTYSEGKKLKVSVSSQNGYALKPDKVDAADEGRLSYTLTIIPEILDSSSTLTIIPEELNSSGKVSLDETNPSFLLDFCDESDDNTENTIDYILMLSVLPELRDGQSPKYAGSYTDRLTFTASVSDE